MGPETHDTVLGIDVGRKNLAMCLVRPGSDGSGASDEILHWAVVSIDPSPAGVVAGMRHAAEWPVGRAVIERQPSKNPTMKRLEHYLEMFFAMRGVRATTIDPKHKLSFAAQSPWWPTRPIGTWSYNERKKLSVETVAGMLARTTQTPGVVDTFAASKKKDDLADACLHAMAYAHNVLGRVDEGPAPARRIKPVAPSPAHVSSGRYSQAGLKHLSRGFVASRADFAHGALGIRGFEASCVRHFGSLDDAYVQLGGK